MKKVIAFFMCAMICLSVCACTGEKANSDMSSSGISVSDLSSSEATISSDHSSSDEKTSSKPKGQNSSKNNTSKNNTSKNTSSKKQNSNNNGGWISDWFDSSSKNSSSQNNSSKKQNTSSDIEFPFFEGTGLVPGKDFGYFTYNGTYQDMAIIGDIVYSIYQGQNTLVVYDSKNLKLLANVSLPDTPNEIQAKDNQIFISFPNLKYVGVYSTTTYEQVSRISVDYRVDSFFLAGAIIYYTELYSGYIYKANVNGFGLDVQVINQAFQNPKIAINADAGIMYIGECGDGGASLYYYELGQKKMVSAYKRGGKGISNPFKSLFVLGDYVYWGGMKFDAKNAENPLAEYSTGKKMYFANDKYIAVDDIIFDINTYQPIIQFVELNYVAITESENLVLDIRDATLPHKVIIIPG